jgi:hypothetical protein
MPPFNPVTAWANSLQIAFIAAEAQAIVAMRLLGMAGVWSVPPGEKSRMISEKLKAIAKSNGNALAAAIRARTPDEVFAAAIKPYRQQTRANTRRLTRRGLKRS